MITAKKLKKLLENVPDDMYIILQKDGEGNDFSPLAGADIDAIYIADTTYSGHVLCSNLSAIDNCIDSEEEWELMKKENPRCCILYPMN